MQARVRLYIKDKDAVSSIINVLDEELYSAGDTSSSWEPTSSGVGFVSGDINNAIINAAQNIKAWVQLAYKNNKI